MASTIIFGKPLPEPAAMTNPSLEMEQQDVADASGEPNSSRGKPNKAVDRFMDVLPAVNVLKYTPFNGSQRTAFKVPKKQLEQVRTIETMLNKNRKNGVKVYKHTKPVLVFDVRDDSSRILLFDVVENSYRFIAFGDTHGTVNLPGNGVRAGIQKAFSRLSEITGDYYLSQNTGQYSGRNSFQDRSIAHVTALFSNPKLNIVVVNFLDKSKELYSKDMLKGIHNFSVGDVTIEHDESIIPALHMIVRIKPDLVCAVGTGRDTGGRIQKKIDKMIRLIEGSLPNDEQPAFINCVMESAQETNQRAAPEDSNEKEVHPNRIPFEEEILNRRLMDILPGIYQKKSPGVLIVPHSMRNDVKFRCEAFGGIIQFVNRTAGIKRGTLGIEFGSSETLCAAVKSGKLVVERLPGIGLGERFSNLCTTNQIEEIIKWLPTEIERSFVEQYILNKSLYPFTTPSSEMELEIEYTIAQQFLKRLLSRLHNKFLDPGKHKKTPIRTSFERIIISGSLFSSAKDDAKKTLTLLNGIQPVGAAAILLDPNQILGALGAAAGENPLMAVQVLDSGIFNHLCTVVAANSRAPDGRRILRVRMVYQNGNEREFEIKKGDFFKLPLMRGETAELFLHPFHGCDVGLGRPGRGGRVRVMGGNVGLIIDARGRPISVRTGTSDRAAQFQTWIQSLSGEI